MAHVLSLGLYLVALLGGVAFVLQQTVNASLRGTLGTPFWAAFTNFAVGAIALGALLLALREPIPSLQTVSRVPWYGWLGGLLGALYIVGSILLVPRLGAATFVGLFIVGQILSSLAFDQFGLLGVPVREVGAARLLGAGLMVVGVGLVCAF
ncbi:DMT family transporter [Methylobacterium haplocladii]|uniref:DMT family transporter n=1 Tax=Methylobacterium haplocladii TaxID=1176176 RepID=A0A512ITZ1_9HYPH|nr:DMT family transporter [Methylobacterium haplocladii]GEP01126.1 hypothetical protein MHA02_35130 [Methylobacterium haplocladii]GJD82914.1 Inner membrane protein YdcZ [Methylobacterium haplocladii]GLS60449.1 hypothetical protein GCM10007887_31280 [Methylobacterium haplocladii]